MTYIQVSDSVTNIYYKTNGSDEYISKVMRKEGKNKNDFIDEFDDSLIEYINEYDFISDFAADSNEEYVKWEHYEYSEDEIKVKKDIYFINYSIHNDDIIENIEIRKIIKKKYKDDKLIGFLVKIPLYGGGFSTSEYILYYN